MFCGRPPARASVRRHVESREEGEEGREEKDSEMTTGAKTLFPLLLALALLAGCKEVGKQPPIVFRRR